MLTAPSAERATGAAACALCARVVVDHTVVRARVPLDEHAAHITGGRQHQAAAIHAGAEAVRRVAMVRVRRQFRAVVQA